MSRKYAEGGKVGILTKAQKTLLEKDTLANLHRALRRDRDLELITQEQYEKALAQISPIKKAKGGKVKSVLRKFDIETWRPSDDKSHLIKIKAKDANEALDLFESQYPRRKDWDREISASDMSDLGPVTLRPLAPLKKAKGGRVAATPQSTLEAVDRAGPMGRSRPKAANRPTSRQVSSNKGRIPLHKVLAEADNDIRSNGRKLASAQVKMARGGRVSAVKPALGRLKLLADKFEAALSAQDQDSIVRIARQLDAAQPGLSKQLMDTAADAGAEGKLAMFAKGGKVAAAKKAAKPSRVQLELTSSPEHSIHDDLRGILEDAGIPSKEHKEIKLVRRELADSDGEDHFHSTELEGAEEHISKIKAYLQSEGLLDDVKLPNK